VLAFVAEFSRGKSELINAIFFADTGRPDPSGDARPHHDVPGRARLGCRRAGGALAAADRDPARWRPARRPEASARAWRRFRSISTTSKSSPQSLQEVTRTEWVERERARALGFWDDDRPDDNPPSGADGRVEVPAWRHAVINYPHPLLKRGLVVLDTPGPERDRRRAGADAEPAADRACDRLHPRRGHRGHALRHGDLARPSRCAGVDPVRRAEQDRCARGSARHTGAGAGADRLAAAGNGAALAVPSDRVFPLSARQALAARVAGDAAGLRTSRLPALEEALGAQLLPQRRAVLEQVGLEGTQQIDFHAGRHIGDQRRQLANRCSSCAGLRGRNVSKVRMMLQRIDAETAEFEHCTTLLQAMRSVHARMLKELLARAVVGPACATRSPRCSGRWARRR
jgi:hypothetical protein